MCEDDYTVDIGVAFPVHGMCSPSILYGPRCWVCSEVQKLRTFLVEPHKAKL